eukprot:3076055-Pyramimonas_sp.AAC.1
MLVQCDYQYVMMGYLERNSGSDPVGDPTKEVKYTNAVYVNGERQAVDRFRTVLLPNNVRVSNFNMRVGGPFVEQAANKPYLLKRVRRPFTLVLETLLLPSQ